MSALKRVAKFLGNLQASRDTWLMRTRPTTSATDNRWAPLTAADLRAVVALARRTEAAEREAEGLRRRASQAEWHVRNLTSLVVGTSAEDESPYTDAVAWLRSLAPRATKPRPLCGQFEDRARKVVP